MTQKDRELLLIDLCARLPYSPIVYVDKSLPRLKLGAATRVWEYVAVDKPCKPYLRPMSSMTEEETQEYERTCSDWYETLETYHWLNAHHFDYRGLISKGLAIEVTKENNSCKE